MHLADAFMHLIITVSAVQRFNKTASRTGIILRRALQKMQTCLLLTVNNAKFNSQRQTERTLLKTKSSPITVVYYCKIEA